MGTCRLVLRMGGAGRVVEPADLDDEIRAEARAALNAYLPGHVGSSDR